MLDITMCPGTNCPHKESCYRFTAKASDWQSVFIDSPIKDGKCDYFWGDNSQNVWFQLQEIVKPK